jgi:hypothetical protein
VVRVDFDDLSDLADFFDADQAAEERSAYAVELHPPDERTIEQISGEQWEAAFGEYVDNGQISLVDAYTIAHLAPHHYDENGEYIDANAFDEWGDWVAEVGHESPDGDS